MSSDKQGILPQIIFCGNDDISFMTFSALMDDLLSQLEARNVAYGFYTTGNTPVASVVARYALERSVPLQTFSSLSKATEAIELDDILEIIIAGKSVEDESFLRGLGWNPLDVCQGLWEVEV